MEPAFIDANGVKLAYLEQGEGPLVVLVHGFPDTAHTWDRVMPAVAELGFRAVAPFTRGYWPSEAKGPYDSDTLGADIVALIEALGETSAIVVGHDWGASAAYAAAGSRPDRVRMLITLAIPHPKSLKPTPLTIWKIRHFFTLSRKGAAAKIRANGYRYIDELWRRWSPAVRACSSAWRFRSSEICTIQALNSSIRLAFCGGRAPMMPALHASATSSGPETAVIGAQTAGSVSWRRMLWSKAMKSPLFPAELCGAPTSDAIGLSIPGRRCLSTLKRGAPAP